MEVILFFKKHYLALFFSLLVGLISVAPQFFSVWNLKVQNQGFPFIYLDDEDNYLTRMQEIVDGHWLAGSPVFNEYKNSVPANLPLSEYFYVLSALLFGWSLTKILIFSKFFLPSLLFLLVYFLVNKLTSDSDKLSNKINAAAAGLMVTLGYDLVDYHYAWSVLSGQLQETHLLIWTRPVNPVFGALLLFIFLLLLYQAIENKNKHSWWILGIILGLTIAYFFSWFLALSLLLIFIVWSFYFKNKKLSFQLFGSLAISLIVQLPYWHNIFFRLQGVAGKEFAMRNGMFFTHVPIFNKFLLLVTIIFLPFFIREFWQRYKLKEKLDNWWWFCMVVIVACWTAFTEQIVTGRTIWPYHFVQYTIPLLLVVLFVFGFNYFRGRLTKIWLCLTIFLGIVSLFFGCHAAISFVFKLEDFSKKQSYMQVFNWLNNNSAKDCVVLINEPTDNFARLIPAFTHCNVYNSTYTYFGVTKERVLHNYLVLLKFMGIKPENLDAYLRTHVEEINTLFFVDLKQSLSGELSQNTEDSIEQIETSYRSFYQADFASEIKKYRRDYLLSEEQLSPGIIADLKLEKINSIKDFNLYKFNN